MLTVERIATWSLEDHRTLHSPIVLRQARLLLLDTIGCACAALASGEASSAINVVAQLGGEPQATLIGSPIRTSAVNAVFANGALVRVLDLNDITFVSQGKTLGLGGHRSDNIPVALAIAELCAADGRAVLEAIILNYELYGRLQHLMPKGAPWDVSSVSGMVAAAMCGRIMGLDARRLAHSLALAAVRSATPRIVRSGNVSAAKSLANAFAAQAGVHSAMLAAEGITGPLEILDDRKAGLFEVFGPDTDRQILSAEIPEVPAILETDIKNFPCIGTCQTGVQAALNLRDELSDRTDKIARIEVIMADRSVVRHQQADPARLQPKSREAADHSFPYLIAVALLDGELTHSQFEGERWSTDAEVLRLMQCLSLGVSEDLADKAPSSMPCRLEIELRDGTHLSTECLCPSGHSFPDQGLDQSVVEEKYFEVVRGALAPSDAEAVLGDVLSIEQDGRLQSLMNRLAFASTD